mgnify:CR=1 FL=1
MNTETSEIRSLSELSEKEQKRLAAERAERVPINREAAREAGWKPIDNWVAVKNKSKRRRQRKIADASRRRNRK